MIATFIGHKDCSVLDNNYLTGNIVSLIENGADEFYCGGMGSFDMNCAGIIYKLKNQYKNIKSYLVIPYLSFNVINEHYYDEIIFPNGFEKYYFKSAILARNKYLVEKADICLCYINHSWGGAYKTLQNAIKAEKKIINLGDLK